MPSEFVYNAGGQGSFRPDDGEVDVMILRKDSEPDDVVGCHCHAFGKRPDPGIAWGAIEFRRRRALSNLPRQGVFTPCASDNQNVHRETRGVR
jgi:hypothetical protein